jgi:hypothetical protein
MRTLLLVMVASLAGACVMEEPADELPGVSWSGAETEAAIEDEASADPDIGRQPRRDDCVANVRGCLASGLSREPGGQPGASRCSDCLDICQGASWWPDWTYYGGDCRWWLY